MSKPKPISSPLGGFTTEELFSAVLIRCGLNPADEHLRETPTRWIKALKEQTANYKKTPTIVKTADYNAALELKATTFEVGSASDQLIVVRDIDIASICGHHLAPFFGKAHIGYLPGKAIIGISKLARIADFFAKRPQTQEFLTAEIKDFLQQITGARFVGVYLECQHTCMSCRGAHKPDAVTITSAFYGAQENDTTKKEFLQIVLGRK